MDKNSDTDFESPRLCGKFKVAIINAAFSIKREEGEKRNKCTPGIAWKMKLFSERGEVVK